jgi:dienelactone hydrolase
MFPERWKLRKRSVGSMGLGHVHRHFLDRASWVIQRGTRQGTSLGTIGIQAMSLVFVTTTLLLTTSISFLPASETAAGAASMSPKYAVGIANDTFVDSQRSTPAWNGNPQLPTRTLVTTILYPAIGPTGGAPTQGATPEKAAGPYPLIVFAHGLGGTPQGYMNVLAAWASQGFVVAAPLFPLSNGNVAGGPDAGDVVNQPKDMSFVINAVLADSHSASGVLSGLVDPDEIGAAGHSNGAVTTLGLVANTCCDDSDVKAAVVMAGTTEGFPPGHYDFSKAPPMLLVHGTADQLIPYRSAPLIYNQARGPKGLLTLVGGSHDAAGGQDPRSASTVIRTTTDFFEAYLSGNRQAKSDLATDGRSPTTRIVLDLTPNSRGTEVVVPAVPVVHLRASVSPNHNLSSGEAVTVQWSGYTAGKVINILECSHVDISTGSSAGCTFANAGLLHPDPTGSGHFTMHIVTGPVGNGTCDATHPCSIAVNNASSLTASNTRVLPITFGPPGG